MRSRAPTLPTTAGPVCSPKRVRKPGRPRLRHFSESRLPAAAACRAARQALAMWSGSSSGAFQNAMMLSPMYLSIMPRLAEIAEPSASK